MRPRPTFLLVLLLAVTCPGQDSARWLADLGDSARGEAAEIALVAMGERAAPLLLGVLQETGDDARVRRARQAAALRVLALLGPDAAAVGADLGDVTVDKDLLPQWVNARAALEPWAQADWQQAFHKRAHEVIGGACSEVFVGFARHQGRKIPVDLDTGSLLDRLAQNRMFDREAVADLLGRKGDAAAVEPLCRMLAARDVAPAGNDILRHNGFVVPIDDGFRFAASEAVVRLAPDDPRAAIAWSGRALLHPHRTVRRAALAALARCAPDIDDTVPDLLAIARGNDQGLAVEAIKLLGMARSGGAAVIGELEQLAATASGDVAAVARAQVARLHAAGIVAAPPAAAAADAKLAVAVAALQDGSDVQQSEPWRDVLAAGNAALPLLLERLRSEHDRTPLAVVAAIARIGRSRPDGERDDLRAMLYLRFSDTWNAGFLSCSTGGARQPTQRELRPDGELALGAATDVPTLARALNDDNPFVRLAAAKRLAEPACAADLATSSDVPGRLIAAAREPHPKRWSVHMSSIGTNQEVDVDADIHAACAAALVACELPAELRAEFLPLLLAGDDAERIAQGLRRWADVRSLPALDTAALDPRPQVAIAAVEAIGSLGKDGAPSAKLLHKLAEGDRPDVAAAARAALQAVGGG